MKNLILFIALCLLFACKKEDEPSSGKYNDGIFVLNEGNFGTGNGSISYWNRENKSSTTDIFSIENGGALVGNILQSMTVSGDRRYLVVNNSNKIVVTDLNFKFINEIKGFELPRYIKIIGDQAFVTQWGADGISGSLKIVNLSSSTITNTIALGKGPENILLRNSKLYIGSTGGYDVDNKIWIINPTSLTIEKTLTLSDNPSIFAELDGHLYILCKGYYNFNNPANSTDGALVRLKDDEIDQSYPIGGQAERLVAADNALYLTNYGSLNKFTAAGGISSLSLNKLFYGLGVDTKTGNIVGLDAKNYASSGQAYIIDGTSIIDSFTTGIIPTEVYTE